MLTHFIALKKKKTFFVSNLTDKQPLKYHQKRYININRVIAHAYVTFHSTHEYHERNKTVGNFRTQLLKTILAPFDPWILWSSYSV